MKLVLIIIVTWTIQPEVDKSEVYLDLKRDWWDDFWTCTGIEPELNKSEVYLDLKRDVLNDFLTCTGIQPEVDKSEVCT